MGHLPQDRHAALRAMQVDRPVSFKVSPLEVKFEFISRMGLYLILMLIYEEEIFSPFANYPSISLGGLSFSKGNTPPSPHHDIIFEPCFVRRRSPID